MVIGYDGPEDTWYLRADDLASLPVCPLPTLPAEFSTAQPPEGDNEWCREHLPRLADRAFFVAGGDNLWISRDAVLPATLVRMIAAHQAKDFVRAFECSIAGRRDSTPPTECR